MSFQNLLFWEKCATLAGYALFLQCHVAKTFSYSVYCLSVILAFVTKSIIYITMPLNLKKPKTNISELVVICELLHNYSKQKDTNDTDNIIDLGIMIIFCFINLQIIFLII